MRTRQTERHRRSAAVRLLSLSDSDSDQAPGESDARVQRDTDALLGPADDPLRQGTVPGVPGMKLGCVSLTLVERQHKSRVVPPHPLPPLVTNASVSASLLPLPACMLTVVE